MSNRNSLQSQQRPSPFAKLANEITQLVIGEALGQSQIRVEPGPNGSGIPQVRISKDVLQIALTSRQFQLNLINVLHTLTCVHEARPIPGQIPPHYEDSMCERLCWRKVMGSNSTQMRSPTSTRSSASVQAGGGHRQRTWHATWTLTAPTWTIYSDTKRHCNAKNKMC